MNPDKMRKMRLYENKASIFFGKLMLLTFEIVLIISKIRYSTR